MLGVGLAVVAFLILGAASALVTAKLNA